MENKLETKQEIATIELINKHFWKSKIGPISALTIPLFLMTMYMILTKAVPSEYSLLQNNELFISGLPSYLAFSILPLCFLSLPLMVVEFKTSIILRKISNSRITKTIFCLTILSFHFLIIMLSSLLIILFYAIFLNVDAPSAFARVSWLELIYALFNVYITGLAFGLMLGTLLNKVNIVQIIGFCLLIISISFSGQFVPLTVISKSDAIKVLSLFSPMTYSLNQMNIVLLNNDSELANFLIGLPRPEWIENDKDFIEKLNIYNSYKFNGLFDVNNEFKLFSFGVVNMPSKLDPEKIIPHLTKITVNEIYKQWQMVMNLVMPYVVALSMFGISLWKFKWTSR